MKKLKAVLQQSTSDCGSACIATILQYYGKTVSSRKIREAAGTDASGKSGLGIVKAAEKFGLSCTGILVTEKEKINTIPFPAIFQFKYDSTEHYIVPYGIKKDRVYYSDPEVGLTSDTIENFNTKWSGIAFLLHPTSEFEKGSDTRNVFSRFLVLLRPYRRYVAEAFLSSVFISAFGIFMSLYFRFLIDEVLYSQVKSTLNLCSICYLLVVVMQVLLNFCRNQILTYLGSKMDVSLVSDFYMHLLKLPLDFFTKRKTGEILSRINDANVIRNAVSSTLLSVAMDGVMVVLGAVFMAQMGSSLLLVSIIPVVISAIIVSILRKPFQSRIKAQAVHEAEKNAALYETINGIATVKGLATEDTAFLRCESRIVEAAMKNLELRKLGNTQNAILTFISSCGTLSMYWFGSFMIFKNQITLGQLISFVTLSGYFLGPLSRLLTMQSYWQEVFVSAERLGDVMDIPEEQESSDNMEDVKSLQGDIEFKNVSFSYGTRGKAISDVSLKIPFGSKVAFVGMSGSGKSTLLKLLMKFYQCEEGLILVNGKDINEYTNDSYRSRIGYVPQESLLFSGSIKENITWGCYDATQKKVLAASIVAQAEPFISRLPDKFNTMVGEQGSTLSGGERQRIAMARILVRDPDIIVLDEATASLDSISEQKITETVYKHLSHKTVVMVAHRLSTIRDCDLIYVFNQGKLVEQGNHDSLLEADGKYAQMWRAQNEKRYCLKASE